MHRSTIAFLSLFLSANNLAPFSELISTSDTPLCNRVSEKISSQPQKSPNVISDTRSSLLNRQPKHFWGLWAFLEIVDCSMPFREYRREPTRLQRQLLSGMGYTDRLFLGNRSRLIFYLPFFQPWRIICPHFGAWGAVANNVDCVNLSVGQMQFI